jgi:hypothetical protein
MHKTAEPLGGEDDLGLHGLNELSHRSRNLPHEKTFEDNRKTPKPQNEEKTANRSR